jgi:hypothetical protein
VGPGSRLVTQIQQEQHGHGPRATDEEGQLGFGSVGPSGAWPPLPAVRGPPPLFMWAADARSRCDRGGCCGCAARRSDRIESIQSHERSFWEQGQEHEHCSKNGVMASWEQDQLIRYLIGIIHWHHQLFLSFAASSTTHICTIQIQGNSTRALTNGGWRPRRRI